MPKFKYDDIEINYRKEGSGEPLVLISGLGSNMRRWDFQIPHFIDKMMVITLDNRGTGESSRPTYSFTMDMFVEDVKHLLDHLNIKEKIHLCGISMGGMIAQHFTMKYPDVVKTLLLLATTPKTETAGIAQPSDSFRKSFDDPEAAFQTRLAVLYTSPFRRKIKKDEQLFDKLKSVVVENPTTAQDYFNQAAAIAGHDTIDQLSKIKQPTLILVGNKDRLAPHQNSELLHEYIPNSKLEIIDGVGHGFIVEVAEKVNETMWNFIKEHLG